MQYDDNIPPVSLFAGLALTWLLVWWPHRDDVPEHHDDDVLDHDNANDDDFLDHHNADDDDFLHHYNADDDDAPEHQNVHDDDVLDLCYP